MGYGKKEQFGIQELKEPWNIGNTVTMRTEGYLGLGTKENRNYREQGIWEIGNRE